MCDFFSFVTTGDGRPLYFDAAMREKIIVGEVEYQDTDSHTSIAHFYGHRGRNEDVLNKYEYNPLTSVFVADQTNTHDDFAKAERNCRALDFGTIVPQLIFKPIINPLNVESGRITDRQIKLLDAWASVWLSEGVSVGVSVEESVWGSVWGSEGVSVEESVWASLRGIVRAHVGASVQAHVWASVRAHVGASVQAHVWASVQAHVGASVRASLWANVWASVRASTWDSLWVSLWAYIGSFFDIYPGEYQYQSLVDLWESGFVPSFDGTTWRLHTGPEARIVYEQLAGVDGTDGKK